MNQIVNSAIRFNGFAEQYDKYRPVPPIDLVKLSLGFLRANHKVFDK
jgi:hypothetical protein